MTRVGFESKTPSRG